MTFTQNYQPKAQKHSQLHFSFYRSPSMSSHVFHPFDVSSDKTIENIYEKGKLGINPGGNIFYTWFRFYQQSFVESFANTARFVSFSSRIEKMCSWFVSTLS